MLDHLLPLGMAGTREEPYDVAPPGSIARRVRVSVLVSVVVMLAVNGNPCNRRPLTRQNAEQGERPPYQAKRMKTSMGQQSMISKTDSQTTTDPAQYQEHQQAFPSEEERGGQSADVNHPDPED